VNESIEAVVGDYPLCTYMWSSTTMEKFESDTVFGVVNVERVKHHYCGALKGHEDNHFCRGCGEETPL